VGPATLFGGGVGKPRNETHPLPQQHTTLGAATERESRQTHRDGGEGRPGGPWAEKRNKVLDAAGNVRAPMQIVRLWVHMRIPRMPRQFEGWIKYYALMESFISLFSKLNSVIKC
jgi:hypothetical protein